MSTITQEQFEATQAAHGPCVVLGAGAGADRVEFVARRIDAQEWTVFLAYQEQLDASMAEAMLRRAVVGATDAETKAEKKRLEGELDADPQLGDLWGVQLLGLAGWQAKVKTEGPAADGTYQLTTEVDGEASTVTARRFTRAQWKELRRLVATKSSGEADLHAFKVSTGRDPADFAAAPALPYVFGHHAMGLGSKVTDAPKKSWGSGETSSPPSSTGSPGGTSA